jgi:hypothetical protein
MTIGPIAGAPAILSGICGPGLVCNEVNAAVSMDSSGNTVIAAGSLIYFMSHGYNGTEISRASASYWVLDVQGLISPTTTNAGWTYQAQTSDSATHALTFGAQNAYASATSNVAGGPMVFNGGTCSTNGNGNPGGFNFNVGEACGAGTDSPIALNYDSAPIVQIQHYPFGTTALGAIYGPVTPSTSNYALFMSPTTTELNVPSGGTAAIGVGGSEIGAFTSSGVVFTGTGEITDGVKFDAQQVVSIDVVAAGSGSYSIPTSAYFYEDTAAVGAGFTTLELPSLPVLGEVKIVLLAGSSTSATLNGNGHNIFCSGSSETVTVTLGDPERLVFDGTNWQCW